MVRVIHHYVPHTTNIGDLFVRDGIHQRLREAFPNVKIVEFPANDPGRTVTGTVGLQGENLERTNAEADLVVVGGSNMYQGPDWRFKTRVEALEMLRPPMAFIGLGVGSIRGEKSRPLTEESKREIVISHRKAIGVAVRDVDTVKFLSGLGIESVMTGCPATFLGREEFKIASVQRVVVSAPPERFLPNWGHRGYFSSLRMRRTFLKTLKTLLREGIAFDVVAQDDKDMSYLSSLLAPVEKSPLGFGKDTQACYELFRKADVALCYRLHMAIACTGFGVPFLLIHFDQRTAAFRNTFQLHQITFDAFGFREQRRLLTSIRALPQFPEQTRPLWWKVTDRREELWEKTIAFYKTLADNVSRK